MDNTYSIEPSGQQWLVAVEGTAFFLCQKRRNALEAVRLANALMNGSPYHAAPEVRRRVVELARQWQLGERQVEALSKLYDIIKSDALALALPARDEAPGQFSPPAQHSARSEQNGI